MKMMETAEKYIYTKYAALGEANRDKRYELIDGTIYFMSPGASQAHQEIVGNLYRQLGDFLEGKPCKVFIPPFDVCLNAEGDDDSTTVQPDILVVCDESKLDGKRCNGTPDLIVEVLSPSNRKYDMYLKFSIYLRAGVREYWIIDPEDKLIFVNILKDGKYFANTYSEESIVPVHVLDGCEIDLKRVFRVSKSGQPL